MSDHRPHFKPQPDEDPREQAAEPLDPAQAEQRYLDADLAEDHPFAALVGNNPRLRKAMATALAVLRDHATDERLRAKIDQAAQGKVSFLELAQDPRLSDLHRDRAEAVADRVDAARDALSDEERERIEAESEAIRAHHGTDDVLSQIRRSFGDLGDRL